MGKGGKVGSGLGVVVVWVLWEVERVGSDLEWLSTQECSLFKIPFRDRRSTMPPFGILNR